MKSLATYTIGVMFLTLSCSPKPQVKMTRVNLVDHMKEGVDSTELDLGVRVRENIRAWHYFDEEGQSLTREEFNSKIDYGYNLDRTVMYDKVIISRLFYRQRFGKLSAGKHQNLINNLSRSFSHDLDPKAVLKIGYFRMRDSEDDCVEFYLDSKWAKKFEEPNYIKVTDRTENTNKYHFPSFYDSLKVLEKVFFTDRISCDNWLAIKPDGSYHIYYEKVVLLSFLPQMKSGMKLTWKSLLAIRK